MFPANNFALNKSAFKSRADECVLVALSISVPVLGESLWCGGKDSSGILILQFKKLNHYMWAIVMLHLQAI